MDQKERIADLIIRYGQQQLNAAELQELSVYLTQQTDSELSAVLDDLMAGETSGRGNLDKEQVFQLIINDKRMASDLPQRSRTRTASLWPKHILRWAAAIIVCCGLGVGMQQWKKGTVDSNTAVAAVILPAKPSANLMLEDGTALPLAAGQQEIVLKDGGIYYTNGETVGLPRLLAEETVVLATPMGATYSIRFADGTHVNLNAGSKISFPLVFSAERRRVELDGEAYFDVQKGTAASWPFEVHSGNHVARVLGTTFNIQAYSDQNKYTTTLYTGSLEVADTKRPDQKMKLLPRQRLVAEKEKAPTLTALADTRETDWTQGVFVFNDRPLSDIVEELERWYNVEFVFQDKLQQEVFTGVASRGQSLQEVLELLELTGTVDFRIHQRKISIFKGI
ncbi:FecR family protein [Sphingobacterium gobiense]|uniref:Anti-sigma factor n=1 Tax=Sphingobacterium gobiense TaxID=1382456 RepID=A0A2S9JS95_9SPHI|nr:FecR family protein [Sphingobacterium gobiense]PRD56078.1 hypothetical protein C5749_02005 [Sphingobacterium gobiense]